jgi:5-methylcytosine-specific restriction protein A
MPSAAPKYRPPGYKPPTYAATRLAVYGSQQWREYSLAYRRAHPLCAECERNGVTKPSRCVDHKKPVTDEHDPLFWEPRNHQALCNECHSRKTAKETPAGLNRKRG